MNRLRCSLLIILLLIIIINGWQQYGPDAGYNSFNYNQGPQASNSGQTGYSDGSEISQGICELLLSDWLREKKQRDVEADPVLL